MVLCVQCIIVIQLWLIVTYVIGFFFWQKLPWDKLCMAVAFILRKMYSSGHMHLWFNHRCMLTVGGLFFAICSLVDFGVDLNWTNWLGDSIEGCHVQLRTDIHHFNLKPMQVPMVPIAKPDEMGLGVYQQPQGVHTQPDVYSEAERGVPTMIVWNHGGSSVSVIGSWDNWSIKYFLSPCLFCSCQFYHNRSYHKLWTVSPCCLSI